MVVCLPLQRKADPQEEATTRAAARRDSSHLAAIVTRMTPPGTFAG